MPKWHDAGRTCNAADFRDATGPVVLFVANDTVKIARCGQAGHAGINCFFQRSSGFQPCRIRWAKVEQVAGRRIGKDLTCLHDVMKPCQWS